jgi:TRAP transporter 4TM/12TM fusion protein
MVCKRDFEHLTESEIGSRPPKDSNLHKFISVIAFVWSLFQIWVASPLQFGVAEYIDSSIIILNDAQIRSIHLSFGILLVYLLFPATEKSPYSYVPIHDWVFAIFGVLSVLYTCIFYNQIAIRLGIPTDLDIIVFCIGVILLLEAARRTVGAAMTVIASIFLLYSHFGEIMPNLIVHKDYSLSAIASHQWFSSEGVFGTALGVSADFVFLYVLFGALLEKTGAGNFFIQLSFSLLGKFRGGPAKAAVVSSGLMGMISGSSIANTITVGSLTIPLMKKMGFTPEKAAAIEVSAGVNGQIMPPVMGAAAFLMAEYLSISYTEVIKHAFLPAILIYIALLYIVHIEACKLEIEPIKNCNGEKSTSWVFGLFKSFASLLLFTISCGLVYFLIEGGDYFIGIKSLSGKYSPYIIGVFIISIYIFLLKYQARYKNFDIESNETDAWVVFKSGLHHFLAIIILIWCLLVEHMSPALSAYWTIIFLVFELFTKNIIISLFNKDNKIAQSFREGFKLFVDAMIMGAKNMTVVSIATATAGIIVGSVSLTGVGLKISGILDYIANGNFYITLFFTAFICIILGMGMPTTACYIIVSTLMVPVLQYITQKNAIYVPLFAMHLFVFYFGLMADVTPPVGLASYAAAAIAGANAMSTGIQAFFYNIRTMILPFLFILNPEILAFNIDSIFHLLQVILFSIIGILTITGGSQGYFIVRNKLYESVLLIFIGVSMMCPQIVIDIIKNPFVEIGINQDTLLYRNTSNKLQFIVSEKNFFSQIEKKKVIINTKPALPIVEQLEDCGLSTEYNFEHNNIDITAISYNKNKQCASLDTSSKIVSVKITQEQPKRVYIYIFSIFMLFAIIILQKRRNKYA